MAQKSPALAVIVLAAGQGKRMALELPKVLVPTDEQPLLGHVLETAASLSPDQLVIVTGFGRDLVENFTRKYCAKFTDLKLNFALQKDQNGTGDAVRSALPALKDFVGTVVILYGDVPLLQRSALVQLLEAHQVNQATLSLLSFNAPMPHRYGRVIRDSKSGDIVKIVEAKDCSPLELFVPELNSGIYAVDSAFLWPAVESLKNENSQKEYYLTDIVAKAATEGQRIACLPWSDSEEMLGVNTPWDLALVNQALNRRQVRKLIDAGVKILDPNSVYIDRSVIVSAGASIGPSVQLRGNTSIAENAVLDGLAFISNCKIEAKARIKIGVSAEDAFIGPGASVGPFAHLRPGTSLGAEVKIGNFVETKNAVLDKGAKASHLTYLGDCKVGAEANIGAGTITCNYDGFNKFKTDIGAGAFIGSNSSLVAPVKIGQGATVGAGSVITKDVEAESLAVTRAPQISKPGWSKRKRLGASAKGASK